MDSIAVDIGGTQLRAALYPEEGIEARVIKSAPTSGENPALERRGILLLYRAEPVASIAQAAPAAGDDVSDVRWFAPDTIPWDEIAFESTAETLRAWLKTLE